MNNDIHSFRKTNIMKDYPNIKEYYGPEWRSKWISLGLLILHISIGLNIHKLSPKSYFIITYFIGATITQALFLAIHELSHNLFFKNIKYNKLFSILLNLPIIIPFSIAFRDYHIEHHKNLGIQNLDTDLPSNIERKFIKGKFKKVLWLSSQIICYALRPVLTKTYKATFFHFLNVSIQLLFNALIYKYFGYIPFVYFLMSDLISGGLHPCSYHFISEHYLLNVNKNQETYSYYGILNYVTWNVGYHNEHHDFPNIPWSRLPKVKKIAPDYYNTLIYYDNWYDIFYKFIFNNGVNLKSRKINKI